MQAPHVGKKAQAERVDASKHTRHLLAIAGPEDNSRHGLARIWLRPAQPHTIGKGSRHQLVPGVSFRVQFQD